METLHKNHAAKMFRKVRNLRPLALAPGHGFEFPLRDLEPAHRDQLLDVRLELDSRRLDRGVGVGCDDAAYPPAPAGGSVDVPRAAPHQRHQRHIGRVVVSGLELLARRSE
jgi:hypothetical protein